MTWGYKTMVLVRAIIPVEENRRQINSFELVQDLIKLLELCRFGGIEDQIYIYLW